MPENLPIEQALALSHANGEHKARLAAFLKLDRRLGQFVSQSKEGMLTQMRIAWWRDQFVKPIAERPAGDPILDAFGVHWRGEEAALVALVNGWEALLAEPPLPDEAALEFIGGRAACFAAMARLVGLEERNASHCGAMWAFADLASRMSEAEERKIVLGLAEEQCSGSTRLPYNLRSLAILGTLGQRALDRGEGPLVVGRRDIMRVLSLGLTGR